MTANYVPLDKEKHANLKVNLRHDFAFAKDAHMAATTIREFPQIGGCMPIAFIKDPSTENFHTIAMFGLEQGSNLYMKDGKWIGHAVPMSLQRFPFDVRPDGERLGIFIDENSEYVGEEGEALFTESGEVTDFLKNRNAMLSDIASSELANQQFVKKLQELNLLEEMLINVTYVDGQRRSVSGVFSISEQRLNELSNEDFMELKGAGYIGAIYALLLSLGQINRLVHLSQDTANPIRHIQMGPAKAIQEAQEKAEAEAATQA